MKKSAVKRRFFEARADFVGRSKILGEWTIDRCAGRPHPDSLPKGEGGEILSRPVERKRHYGRQVFGLRGEHHHAIEAHRHPGTARQTGFHGGQQTALFR